MSEITLEIEECDRIAMVSRHLQAVSSLMIAAAGNPFEGISIEDQWRIGSLLVHLTDELADATAAIGNRRNTNMYTPDGITGRPDRETRFNAFTFDEQIAISQALCELHERLSEQSMPVAPARLECIEEMLEELEVLDVELA